ncbi:hypothetical protein C8J98_10533 [Luteibacter sp. OK325]|nr:hypothetical protein C8J98_10533 [Luteibacter sp. OK325]
MVQSDRFAKMGALHSSRFSEHYGERARTKAEPLDRDAGSTLATSTNTAH